MLVISHKYQNCPRYSSRDTVTLADNPTAEALPGYRKMNPMVYCGLYPIDTSRYNDLREALEKLQLNDAALQFEPETSQALGFGFRCGFLGLLHMDVVQERLEREFNQLITTAPSVIYHVNKTDGTTATVDNPADFPEPVTIQDVEEPFVKHRLWCPMICRCSHGTFSTKTEFITMDYLDDYRVNVVYNIPLSEIVFDFFDKLKPSTKAMPHWIMKCLVIKKAVRRWTSC